MATFRVYVHDGPLAFGPPPSVPPTASGVIALYWCELLDQATIDNLGYGVSGVTPPSQPDGGYSTPGATNFAVTQFCVQEVDNHQAIYNQSPYEYTLVSPAGQVIRVPTTPIQPAPGIWQFCIAQPILQAKGIWRIDVSLTPCFVTPPSIGTWPNHIIYVMPHNRKVFLFS